MWTIRSERVTDGLRYAVEHASQPASFADVVRAWRTDVAFRTLFNGWLATAPYTAFRWETLPVTISTTSQPFEFVLTDCPDLAGRPDLNAFAEHFAQPTGVAVFPNLGGNAVLVVPCPLADPSAYGHLAAFVRSAPEKQRDALWQAIGEAMARRIGTAPVWLSTAGAGVSWLHVRLDDRPKYYQHTAYKKPPDN